MDTPFRVLATVQAAENLGESLSVWCIRASLAILVLCIGAELAGVSPVRRSLAVCWILGALLAAGHSLGALWTFHHGSQAEALESTARQTREMLGFAFSAGLYINYLFVVVWLADSLGRIAVPDRYLRISPWNRWLVLGFLLFIAWNGTVVFKDGIIRGVGLAATILLVGIWALGRNRRPKV